MRSRVRGLRRRGLHDRLGVVRLFGVVGQAGIIRPGPVPPTPSTSSWVAAPVLGQRRLDRCRQSMTKRKASSRTVQHAGITVASQDVEIGVSERLEVLRRSGRAEDGHPVDEVTSRYNDQDAAWTGVVPLMLSCSPDNAACSRMSNGFPPVRRTDNAMAYRHTLRARRRRRRRNWRWRRGVPGGNFDFTELVAVVAPNVIADTVARIGTKRLRTRRLRNWIRSRLASSTAVSSSTNSGSDCRRRCFVAQQAKEPASGRAWWRDWLWRLPASWSAIREGERAAGGQQLHHVFQSSGIVVAGTGTRQGRLADASPAIRTTITADGVAVIVEEPAEDAGFRACVWCIRYKVALQPRLARGPPPRRRRENPAWVFG